jgi:hypothetical protein
MSFMLSFSNNPFVLSIIMLNVVMLSAVMLNVVALTSWCGGADIGILILGGGLALKHSISYAIYSTRDAASKHPSFSYTEKLIYVE